jgi:hypothetical protein
MSEMTNPTDGFDRRLFDNATKIESVCLRCGAVIIGSVLNGLPELETVHLAECKKPSSSIRAIPSKKTNRAS